ncbi:hypothetical protein Tco_0751221 [Tanacetum coccineum]|uniref:Uncharacterized protein n=1 Tax=Tanacetum coccineum TaxID=301880 RepID=A0ABQ4Z4F4_9ASTR
MKMEILHEPTSNKLMVVTHWFTHIVLSALRRSDNENMLSRSSRIRSDKVLKLKKFKKDALLKAFQDYQIKKGEHVGPEVTSSRDGKVYKMAKRDYAWLMISRSSKITFMPRQKN